MVDHVIRTPNVSFVIRSEVCPIILLGRQGLSGQDAKAGVTLMVGGKPSAGLALGPYFPTAPQSFTSAASTIGCKIAPTADAAFTIRCEGVSVGTAVILAGQRRGSVTLTNGGFTAQRDDEVEAICPATPDATLSSPSLSLA